MHAAEQNRIDVLGWRGPDGSFRARLFGNSEKIWECTHAHRWIEDAWECGKLEAAARANGDRPPV